MSMKGKKIDIKYDQQRRVARIICSEIASSRSKNKKNYDLIERCQNQYDQLTYWEKIGKEPDVPFQGASDFFIPLSEWIVDALHSRVMHILFHQEPVMKAKGTEANDIQKAPDVTDFVDTVHREIVQLRKNVNHFFRQMIALPLSVLKYHWVRDVETMYIREMADVYVNPENGDEEYILPDDPELAQKMRKMIEGGYLPTSDKKEVPVKKEVEKWNAPKLEYIKPADYVYCPTAQKGHRLYWEGDRFYMTWNEILMKKKDEQFYDDGVEKVRKHIDDSTRDNENYQKDVKLRSTLFECYNWYGRLPFDADGNLDFESEDSIEHEVHAQVVMKIGSAKIEELLYLSFWEYKRLPDEYRVYLRGGYEETDNFMNRSLLMKLYKIQKLANTFYNTLINNAYLAMMKIFKRKKDWISLDTEDELDIYPGVIVDVEDMNDFEVMDVGDVKSIGITLENDILSFAERLSNISDWNLGVSRSSKNQGSKPTATEFTGVIAEGQIGHNKFIQNCHDILRKICQWTHAYYEENMPVGFARRITGENGEEIYPTQENLPYFQEKGVQPFWTVDQISGKYDFTWNNTALNSSMQWNISVSNDLMDRYMQTPMVSGNLMAVWNILKDGLIARGIKDWQRFLPQKEAIVAEMQRMQQEAQAQQQMDQNRKALPQKVAQKLIQRGANPQEAMQMAGKTAGMAI